ncbi:MAG: discoidin domain-containing protein, partial [Clostridia bacterium]|nr:discoidin domain-containing protein [Clostridia bacterium]
VAYGDPITDTNTSDGVVDGFHVFMWYDVPLTSGGQTKIEIRGIDSTGNTTATSLNDNGEVAFTAADVTKLVLTSNDTTKVKIIENTVNLIGGENSGVTVADILGGTLVSVPDGSSVAVLDESGNTVTEGALAVGMTVRVLDEIGNYMNYIVAAEATNIAEYKTVTVSSTEKSSNPASMAVDGIITSDASNSWKAKNSAAGEWITVDLGEEYHLNKLDVYFETKDARVYPFEAQIKGDNTSFTTAIDRSSNTDSAYTTDNFADNTLGRYVKLLFGVCNYNGNKIATVREIEVYGWRFVNTGGYVIDEANKVIYLGAADSEHDTNEVFSNLKIDGQASYDFELQEAGRVLSDGDKLVVTELYGGTVEYTLNLSSN